MSNVDWAPLIYEFEQYDHEQLVDVVIASSAALAIRQNDTPRNVIEDVFKASIDDDEWKRRFLPSYKLWKIMHHGG